MIRYPGNQGHFTCTEDLNASNSSPTVCPQRLSLRISPGTSRLVGVLLGHCLRASCSGQLPAACGRASSAAMYRCFRCPRTCGKYGHIRAAVHCVRLLANRTAHTVRTRWTSLQSRNCIPKALFPGAENALGHGQVLAALCFQVVIGFRRKRPFAFDAILVQLVAYQRRFP